MSVFFYYQQNNYEDLKSLLATRHPDQDRNTTTCGNTLLAAICQSSRRGDERYVKLLLEKGANPNFSRFDEYTGTNKAELINRDRPLKLLMGQIYGDKETRIKIESLLLEYGAKVDYQIYRFDYRTASRGKPSRAMLSNNLVQSAVNNAINQRDPRFLALLVKHGAVDHLNHTGKQTSLQYLKGRLRKYSSPERARYQTVTQDCIMILEKGYVAYAAKQARQIESQQKAEKAAAERLRQEQTRKAAETKKRQTEIQQRAALSMSSAAKIPQAQIENKPHDYSARQLFHLFQKKDLSGFKALLESEYNPNLEPNSHWGSVLTQICACSLEDQDKYVALLLKHGADPDVVSQNKQYCPLKMALISSGSNPKTFKTRLKTVKLLLEAGANANFPPAVNNHPGWGLVYTPLAAALNMSFGIGKGNTDLIVLLLRYGSKDVKNKSGHTAVDQLKNARSPYFSGRRPLPNRDEFITILELGHEGYENLIKQREQEKLAELYRQAQAEQKEKELDEDKSRGLKYLHKAEGSWSLSRGYTINPPMWFGLKPSDSTDCQISKGEFNHHMRVATDFNSTSVETARAGTLIQSALNNVHKYCPAKKSKGTVGPGEQMKPELNNVTRRCQAKSRIIGRGVTSEEHNAVIEGIEADRASKIRLMHEFGAAFLSYAAFKLFYQKHKHLSLEEFKRALGSLPKSRSLGNASRRTSTSKRVTKSASSKQSSGFWNPPPRPIDIIISDNRSRRVALTGDGGYGRLAGMTTEEIEEERAAKIQFLHRCHLSYTLMRSLYSRADGLSIEEFRDKLDGLRQAKENRNLYYQAYIKKRIDDQKWAAMRKKSEVESRAASRRCSSAASYRPTRSRGLSSGGGVPASRQGWYKEHSNKAGGYVDFQD